MIPSLVQSINLASHSCSVGRSCNSALIPDTRTPKAKKEKGGGEKRGEMGKSFLVKPQIVSKLGVHGTGSGVVMHWDGSAKGAVER